MSSRVMPNICGGVAILTLLWVWPALLCGQVLPPDRRSLFEEDAPAIEQARDAARAEVLQVDSPTAGDMDLQAPEIRFDQENNRLIASGGLLLSQPGLQVQAEQGVLNVDTNDLELEGGVFFAWPEGEVLCDRAELNTTTETGVFSQAYLALEGSDYQINTEQLNKVSEDRFELEQSVFTTCRCPDGAVPWSISCRRAKVRQEGYARTYGTTVRFYDWPVFYSPYFIFPIKQERQSGLLAPKYGYNSRDGLKLDLPFFIVPDDHSDILVRPFTETEARTGVDLDYRQVFSRRSRIDAGLIYSDESARDDSLQGTNIEGVFDPEIDTERWGGYYRQQWRNQAAALVPLSFSADLRHVSDNLFLRELEDENIGQHDARYLTSQALVQSSLGPFVSAEAYGSYSQAFYSDPDLTFQRLPELNLNYRQGFRPFGYNPYGLRLNTGLQLAATNFDREEGYRGERYRVIPTIKVPHHYKNYVNASLDLGLYQNYYNLSDSQQPYSSEEVIGESLQVPQLGYRVGTALERTVDLAPSHPLVYLSGLGAANQDSVLRRVRHVVEPMVRYAYIPEIEQDDNPFFDSLDRIRQRSLFTYGFSSTLLGRFVPRGAAQAPIAELTPEIEDLPALTTSAALPDLDGMRDLSRLDGRWGVDRGDIRRLAVLDLWQTYDYLQDRDDSDPDRKAFSDFGLALKYFPSRSFAFEFNGNLSPYENQLSSWGAGVHLRDDRGDMLRARYTYVDNQVNQVEANLEVVMTERLKLGYYARYDGQATEFLEQGGALRLFGSCNCWSMDLGVVDRINPDKTDFFLTIKLFGLGDITQSFGMDES